MKRVKHSAGAALLLLFLAGLSAPGAARAAERSGLLFAAGAGGADNLFLYDLVDLDTAVVTDFPDAGGIYSLSVTGDGGRVFFSRPSPLYGRPNAAAWQVYPDGSGLALLAAVTPDPALDYRHLAVSPDGALIAYTANSAAAPADYDLFVVKADGTDRRQLYLTGFPHGYTCSYPVFLDDQRVLFLVRHGLGVTVYDECYDYYVINVNGTGQADLTGNRARAPYFPRLGRPVLSAGRDRVIHAHQVQAPEGFLDWSLREMRLENGGSLLVSDRLYFDPVLAPFDQVDPQPAYAGADKLVLAGTFFPATPAPPADLYLSEAAAVQQGQFPYQQRLTVNAGVSLPLFFTVPPPPSRIAWIRGGELVLVDGRDLSVRTLAPPVSAQPALSSDGVWAAFVRGETIWRVRVDNTGLAAVDAGAGAGFPVFSPCGRWLAYVRDGTRIYYRDAGLAGPPVELAAPGFRVEDLAFAPDGRALAFTGRSGDERRLYSLAVRIGGSTVTAPNPPVLLSVSSAADFHPVYSADSADIYFVSRRSGRNELWVMRRDGAGQRMLPFTVLPANPLYPRFAPDGTDRLAFLAGGASGVPGQVWYADLVEEILTARQPAGAFLVATAERFDWSRLPSGRAGARRAASFTIFDPALPLRYSLVLDINADRAPVSILVTEKLPAGWVLDQAQTTPVPFYVSPAGDEARWLFGPGSGALPVTDTEIRLVVDVSGDAGPSGAVRYLTGTVGLSDATAITSGDTRFTVAGADPLLDPGAPYPALPVDLDGDWSVSDGELLLAIDRWSRGAPVDGWPQDLGAWDDWNAWLLRVIDYWVAGGHRYDPAASLLAVPAAPRWTAVP